jgi:hypothetical protein
MCGLICSEPGLLEMINRVAHIMHLRGWLCGDSGSLGERPGDMGHERTAVSVRWLVTLFYKLEGGHIPDPRCDAVILMGKHC